MNDSEKIKLIKQCFIGVDPKYLTVTELEIREIVTGQKPTEEEQEQADFNSDSVVVGLD